MWTDSNALNISNFSHNMFNINIPNTLVNDFYSTKLIFIHTLYDYFLYELSYASDSTHYLFSDRIKRSLKSCNLLNIHIIKQMIWKFQTDVAFCIYDIFKCILTFKYWYMFQFRTPNTLRNNAHKHHYQNTYYA